MAAPLDENIMMTERKLEDFREETKERFNEIRSDIKELTLALRELIRLDGDIKRLNEVVERIGDQVKTNSQDIGLLKIATARSSVTVGVHERWFWVGVSFIFAVAGGILTKLVM